MATWVSLAGLTFKSVDWFVPPYLQGGALRRLAETIDGAPPNFRHTVLEDALPKLYGPEYLAAMLLERYPRVAPVSEFITQIREAMEASALGLRHVAVSTLLPVIEGSLRKYASANGRDVGSGTKKLVDELSAMAQSARASDGGASDDALVERAEMMEQLRDFMRERLLSPTGAYAGINDLNRHGILHGVFGRYGTDGNFEKLVSFIDGLVFYLSLKTPGISCLAPDETTESRRMARYLRALRSIRRFRPSATR